ncbi:MAG: MBL fold metallo-hydrolase [Ilumatobacteraceae bacterium]|nr:MBL fold metallo-hydrolase [Ilumatobacteraceae bacterium]
MTRSFDTHDQNVVTTPGGQRVHKDHLAQSDVIKAQFDEVRAGVWCLIGNGLSNQTFIQAPEGIIAIDTGESEEEMAEALRRLREITDAPIAAVIYSHFHYVEGTTAVFKEGNHVKPLPIYGHEKIGYNKSRSAGEIAPAYVRGIVEQFAIAMPAHGADAAVNVGLGFWFRNPAFTTVTAGYLPVTHPIGESASLTIAGLRVEMKHSPSDCDDSVNMYFPEIATCVHNSVWPTVFNVYAIRGEEYRDPRVLIPGVDNIINWAPEYMVATHGPTLSGAENIHKKATRYRDSLQFMWDQSVRAINKGWTTDEIASRVTLPDLYDEDYLTAERYGVIEHHMRQIFIGLRGWFDGDESKLFPLEPVERFARLIEGFGGRSEVAKQSADALANNDIRWATELATWLVRSEGATTTDRELLAACLRVIAERTPAANIRNWAITRARHLDGSTSMERFNSHNFWPNTLESTKSTDLIHTLRVLLEPSKAQGINHHLAFHIDDETCGLHVRNCVAVPTDGSGAQSTATMSRKTLHALMGGATSWTSMVADGSVVLTGDAATIDRIRLAIDNAGLSS